MAENDTTGPVTEEPVPTTTAPVTEEPVTDTTAPYITFDKPTFDSVMGVYGDDIGMFAQNMTEVLDEQYDNSGYVTYKGLREGTAPVFELFPSLKNLAPDQRRLSNEDIIELFAYSPDGDPISAGTFTEGFTREIAPVATSAGGFSAGFYGTNVALSGVPPVSPPTAAIRIVGPILGGTVTAIGGYILGEKVRDEVMGEERPMLPGQRAAYEAGKTAAGVVGYLPLPFLAGSKFSLGTDLIEDAVKNQSVKATEFVEGAVRNMGTSARAAPLRTLGQETLVFGSGATAGAYLAESGFEGQAVPRLIGEFGGALTAGAAADLLTSRLRMAYQGGKSLIKATKDGTITEGLGVLKGKREQQVVNYILDVLEESGEDADEVIRRLGSNEFSESLIDPDTGKPIQLTAALKSGSPGLLALEKSLEKITTGVGKERASANVQATRALRNTILALYANPENKDAIQSGAELAQGVFNADMEQGLKTAWERVFASFDRTRSRTGRERPAALGDALRTALDQRLSAARVDEKRLWSAIPPNFEITEFKDAAGNAVDTPNFITYMDDNLPNTEEAAAAITSKLPFLVKFAKRKKRELGLEPSDGGDGTAPTVSTAVSKATKAFEEQRDKVIGTDDYSFVERTLQRADEIADIDDRVQFLRGQSQNLRLRAKGGEFDDNRLAGKEATLFDRYAELTLARARDTSTDVVPEGEEFTPLLANEIYDMYSEALSEGKRLAATGETNASRIAFGFAEALQKDLNGVDTSNVAYNTARSYSRALNDAFTRSFVGDALATNAKGGPKIAPEQLANRVFSSDAGYLRMKQLDGVGQFELTQSLTNLSTAAGNPDLKKTLDRAIKYSVNPETGLSDPMRLQKWLKNNRKSLGKYPDVLKNVENAVATTSSIRGTTESILRSIKAQSFNPDTGEINPAALRKWMEKPENVDILNAMPALKADLEDVVTARALLDDTTAAARETEQKLKQQVSFMDLLPTTTENPATAAAQAISLNQKKPVQAWNELLKVVDSAPDTWTSPNGVKHTKEDAMKGLQSAFIEASMVRAGGSSTTFDARTFFDTLFAPHRNSQNEVSLAEWMVSKNVMTEPEVKRMRAFATELVKMETFVAKGDMDLSELSETVGPMMDFYLRISGSALGSRAQGLLPGGGGTGSLVAASAGSKAFRDIYARVFSSIPESLKMDVMTEMFKDPDLLATMLSRGRTEKQDSNLAGRIGTLLAEKGFLSAVQTTRRGAPSVVRETEGVLTEEDPRLPAPAPSPAPAPAPTPAPAAVPDTRQGSLSLPRPVTPTTRAAAAPSPVPASAPNISPTPQPVDRTRFAAMFPNDMASGMINSGQGIGSLL